MLNSQRRFGFTLAEGATHVVMLNSQRRFGFTLAEVLVTLGIIGVVAALTMPSLIANYQDNVRKQQFKKAYNTLNNAMLKAKSDLGYSPMCHAWAKYSDRPATAECAEKNEYGTCTRYTCNGGQPCPSNLNGMYEDCTDFTKAFLKNLNIAKTCSSRGYEQGCIKYIKGSDDIQKESNPDAKPDPNSGMSTANLKKRPAYVLADGMILIDLNFNGWKAYAVDINGNKKPNKWGYDIFTFQAVGDANGMTQYTVNTYAMTLTEKGGRTPLQMLQESLK